MAILIAYYLVRDTDYYNRFFYRQEIRGICRRK